MPDPGPDVIALWLTRGEGSLSFRPLLDAAFDVLTIHLPLTSAEDRAEIAERSASGILAALQRITDECQKDGVEPTFELSSVENAVYFRLRESPASQLVAQLLGRSPGEFEVFCAKILGKLGGICTVTGRPGDGQVDFVARDLLITERQGPASIGARVLVLGQAKRYALDNLITENDLRSFIGGSIHRASNHEDTATFRGGILAPVIFAFWTTSDFHPSAKRFARSVGLWYLNGIALAQLAMRLGVSIE